MLSYVEALKLPSSEPDILQMPGEIFVSYRRDDTGGYALALHARLAARFGRDAVFLDLESISPADDFVSKIEYTIANCSILLVLIGKNWMEGDRINDPSDMVRGEISAALRSGVPIIPVLIGGATMPNSARLPAEISAFHRRNALHFNPTNFQVEAEQLIRTVIKTTRRKNRTKSWIRHFLIPGFVLAMLAGLGWIALHLFPFAGPPPVLLAGQVIDDISGESVEGASVSVAGLTGHAVTDKGGNFTLKVQAGQGDLLLVHVEREGYHPKDQRHPAGTSPASVVLVPK